MALTSIGTPAGTPSIIATSRGPCDSPAVRTRNASPSSARSWERRTHGRDRSVEPRPQPEGAHPLVQQHDETVDGDAPGLARPAYKGGLVLGRDDVHHGEVRPQRDPLEGILA